MGNRPKGLPEVDPSAVAGDVSAIEKARICPTCKGKTRIYTNSSGRFAHCGSCKTHFPISLGPAAQEITMTFPRGLHKQTFVEPDWNKAFDGGSGDQLNEQIGPKKRK